MLLPSSWAIFIREVITDFLIHSYLVHTRAKTEKQLYYHKDCGVSYMLYHLF